MPRYVCAHCRAQNGAGGTCIRCKRPLGSLRRAAATSVVAACALAIVWVGVSWLTGLELFHFALIFGVLVSAAVALRNGRRGFVVQGVVSLVTLAGIAVADAVVVRLWWFDINPEWPADAPLPPLLEQLAWQAQWDGLFLAFVVLGLMGGCWLWRG